MAKLYFYYGAMNSSKTANALMTHFNYEEVGQKALLCKTEADTRDGARKIRSRIGLEMECILLKELELMTEEQIRAYDCIIVDEVCNQRTDRFSVRHCGFYGGSCSLLWTQGGFPE